MQQQVDHKQVEKDISRLTKDELKQVIHQLAGELINASNVQQQADIPKDAYVGTSIGFVHS